MPAAPHERARGAPARTPTHVYDAVAMVQGVRMKLLSVRAKSRHPTRSYPQVRSSSLVGGGGGGGGGSVFNRSAHR